MKSLFLLLVSLLAFSNKLICNIDSLYVGKPRISFVYVINENSGLPREMVEQLQQALLSNKTEDFLKRNSANYNIIHEEEREKYAEKEKSGILKEHQENYKNSDEIWIEIGTPELYYVIREKLEDGNYLYYQFFYETGSKIWGKKVSAWGKGEDYFFIQWEGRVYLVTTNHDENGINGVAIYCCKNQTGDYGGMIYMERLNGKINIQEYGLSTTGTGFREPGWVEY